MSEILWSGILYGQPRTKKNSMEIRENRKTGQKFVGQNKRYLEYAQACGYQIRKPKKPISEKVNVKMIYFRDTKRRVDLVNLEEATLDILVRYGVLADDCCEIVHSMDGSMVILGSDKPKTLVVISRAE